MTTVQSKQRSGADKVLSKSAEVDSAKSIELALVKPNNIVVGRKRSMPARKADRHWQTLTNKMARSTRHQRLQLFSLYEDEIIHFVKTKCLV